MTYSVTPTVIQAYTYDGINRLGSVAETVTAGGSGGGAKLGEKAGEVVATTSAKIAHASGDQAMASFYSNNVAAIGVAVAKGIELVKSSADSLVGHSIEQPQGQQQQQQQRLGCGPTAEQTNCP